MNESSTLLRTILSDAINLEKNGLSSYLKLARRTNNITGKNMFIQLAIDEFDHQRILEKLYAELAHQNDWPVVEMPESEFETFVPELTEKQVKIRGASGIAELEALTIASAFEQKAMNYYLEKASIVDNEKGKRFLLRLADMEKAHHTIIQAELDYITQTGFWFDIPEFRMDGKF